MVGSVGVTMPAYAYDDGYQNVFSSVLTAVGLMAPERTPEIDYREHAPLVLPPKVALAKPLQPKAKPTAWPQDPDVIRRRKADEEAKAPVIFEFSRSEQDSRMSREEQLKYRAAPVNEADMTPSRCNGQKGEEGRCSLLSPDEMKAQDEKFKAQNPGGKKDEVTAGMEPEREYLTQPPRGYLKATKTVKATAEAPLPKRSTIPTPLRPWSCAPRMTISGTPCRRMVASTRAIPISADLI